MLISKFTNEGVEQRILQIEEQYDIAVPEEYKSFLYKYNGGYTPNTRFKVGKVSSDIKGFFGVGNVKLSLDSIDLKEWIDNQALPIASDSFGNYIAIGIENGKIFFVDHEKGKKYTCIGENLMKFFEHCKSDKISATAKMSIQEREAALIERGRAHVITDALRQMWQDEIDKYGNMEQEKVIIP